MKLKEVDLTRPHYVITINTATNHILAAKTKYSTLDKSMYNYNTVADEFFIYPHLQDRNSYVDKPIVSVAANPEEEIFVGCHYIRFNLNRFNLNRKSELNYIAFDLATATQLIRDYFKKLYDIVRQTEGIVYRRGYSKDIQGMYKHYLNQIKKYLM